MKTIDFLLSELNSFSPFETIDNLNWHNVLKDYENNKKIDKEDKENIKLIKDSSNSCFGCSNLIIRKTKCWCKKNHKIKYIGMSKETFGYCVRANDDYFININCKHKDGNYDEEMEGEKLFDSMFYFDEITNSYCPID